MPTVLEIFWRTDSAEPLSHSSKQLLDSDHCAQTPLPGCILAHIVENPIPHPNNPLIMNTFFGCIVHHLALTLVSQCDILCVMESSYWHTHAMCAHQLCSCGVGCVGS